MSVYSILCIKFRSSSRDLHVRQTRRNEDRNVGPEISRADTVVAEVLV